MPLQCQLRHRRWFAAACIGPWLITTFLCVTTLGAAIGLLYLGTGNIESYSSSNPFTLGFGAVNLSAVLSPDLGLILIADVLVANSPQLILSFLYFSYNSLWTCMLLTAEWAESAKTRKPLRVIHLPVDSVQDIVCSCRTDMASPL